MNAKAKELGLTDYKFVNATGLENKDLHGHQPEGTSVNEESEVSAKDMAVLADHLITDYPEILETSSIAKRNSEKAPMMKWTCRTGILC